MLVLWPNGSSGVDGIDVYVASDRSRAFAPPDAFRLHEEPLHELLPDAHHRGVGIDRVADRLTEHTNTLETVTKLHRNELRGVRAIWIEVEANPRQYGVVRIRLTEGGGLTLEVWGEDRNSVEGLTQRLVEILGRGAPRLHRVDMGLVAFLLILPLLVLPLWLGPAVTQWLGAAEENDRLEGWEWAGIAVGVAVALLIPHWDLARLPACGGSRRR